MEKIQYKYFEIFALYKSGETKVQIMTKVCRSECLGVGWWWLTENTLSSNAPMMAVDEFCFVIFILNI